MREVETIFEPSSESVSFCKRLKLHMTHSRSKITTCLFTLMANAFIAIEKERHTRALIVEHYCVIARLACTTIDRHQWYRIDTLRREDDNGECRELIEVAGVEVRGGCFPIILIVISLIRLRKLFKCICGSISMNLPQGPIDLNNKFTLNMSVGGL